MSRHAFEYKVFRHPRHGSDYSLLAEERGRDHHSAAVAILDTIGEPRTSQLKKAVRLLEQRMQALVSDAAGDVDAMAAALRAALLEGNQLIPTLNTHQESILGFCITAGVLVDGVFRCFWLGDSRAYYVAPPPTPKANPVVRWLTADHNQLSLELIKAGEYTFLQSETLELSKSLTMYWGKPNQDQVAAALAQQGAEVVLAPGSALLLFTDGVHLPIVRALLDQLHFKLTPAQFSLEDWLARFLKKGGYLDAAENPSGWERIMPQLARFSDRYTAHKPHYRDFMAGVTIYYPPRADQD